MTTVNIRHRKSMATAEQYIKGQNLPYGLCTKKECYVSERPANERFMAGDPHLHVVGSTGFVPEGWWIITRKHTGERSICSPAGFAEHFEVVEE